MKPAAKVLWAEGRVIQPHHLQRQDAYHESRVAQLAQAVHPYLWGVRAVRWNLDALRDNLLLAESLSLVFEDGEVSDAPAIDGLPAAVDLRGLPADTESFVFYAALPLLNEHGGNASQPGAQANGARYGQVARDTADLFSGALPIELAYLTAAVHFRSELETRLSHVSFPVVQIRRATAGGFELDPTFIAPSMSVGASPGLASQLRSLMKKLNTKMEELVVRHSEPSHNVIEVRSGDVTSFLLMQTICNAVAVLGHFARHPGLHPERLFCELLRLAGGLMTFSKAYAPEKLPAYDHNSLGAAFGTLDTMIRELVDTVISARYFMIGLAKDKPTSPYYHGQLEQGKVDQQTQLYLAVNADMPAIELVAAVPLQLKIGAPEDVEKCVASAMAGIGLLHMPQAPAAVPARPNTYYFLLENKGKLYESMLKARAITIYASSGITGLSMELIGVNPN